MAAEAPDFDIVIIGAGVSGINTAYLIQKHLPQASYVILEARQDIAGTWSYWQYPGARSDSPSVIFSFRWHSWPNNQNFADASVIRDYIQSAMRAEGIDRHLRLQQRVDATSWSSAEQLWTLAVTSTRDGDGGQPATVQYRARWVVHATGYYSYDQGQQVTIPGLEQFRGSVVHPQFWAGRPGDDAVQHAAAAAASEAAIAGKRVILLGSGATAVTMLPQVARVADHVTMLQRSPSYVMTAPRYDSLRALLRRWLPRWLADRLEWYVQMLGEILLVQGLTRLPGLGRRLLRRQAQQQLPADVDVDVHFNPRYGPFRQRLCVAPDGDFYAALNRPNCTIVTGTIDTITEDGIQVKTDEQSKPRLLPADTIITATGLHVQLLNGQQPCVDGVPVPIHQRFAWRGCMIEGIPNACFLLGYVTGTWVPAVDTRFRTVLGVLRRMHERGTTSAWPTVNPASRPSLPQRPLLEYSSGYLATARDRVPMSSGTYPWVNGLSWFYDTWYNFFGSPDDGIVYRTAESM